MTTKRIPRVLCVDDEPQVLGGLTRILRRDYEVTTAVGGGAGLEALGQAGPFAVLISDMRMPGIDGVTLLTRARELAPNTVRILLTGHADTQAAIAAVNGGQVFRFLTKPCASGTLLLTLDQAVRQHQLITAERELLEHTLHGSIRVLTDTLAVVFPDAMGRAGRAKHCVAEIAERMGVADRWYIEVAAMLSQLGAITLPPVTARKLYQGTPLTDAEQAMIDRLPAFNGGLLADIPRLGAVRQALAYMNKRYDGQGQPRDHIAGPRIPLGARILKAAIDFDILQTQGQSAAEAIRAMRERTGWYDPAVLNVLADVHDPVQPPAPSRDRPLGPLAARLA